MLHGAALHRELQTLVQLGIPSWKVLTMATSEAARFLDPAADFGRVGRGMRADLVLVDGDPLAEITNTQKIVAVWQAGRKVQRKK
jgi:imidazolonepropionase-like amidohydrolase